MKRGKVWRRIEIITKYGLDEAKRLNNIRSIIFNQFEELRNKGYSYNKIANELKEYNVTTKQISNFFKQKRNEYGKGF